MNITDKNSKERQTIHSIINYKIEANIPRKKKNYIQTNNWGEFSVYKEFNVYNSKNKREGVFGYVVQKVDKNTNIIYLEDNKIKKINTTEDIMKFTSNQVNYSNTSYYEIFFIINGISTVGDIFQNGAILHYNIENTNDIYADDEVPTAGTIVISGESFFIKDSKENVIKNSKKKNPKIYNMIWDTDDDLPSNGLPYSLTLPEDIINNIESNIIIHKVSVKWDGIRKILNNNLSNKLNTNTHTNINTKTTANNANNISNIFKKLNISNKKSIQEKTLNEHSIVVSEFIDKLTE